MTDFDSHPESPDMARIRGALEEHASQVRTWALGQIREIEELRDTDLRRVEDALACVEGGGRRPAPRSSESPPPRSRSRRKAKRSRSRRSPSSTKPEDVRRRREAVARLLEEGGGPFSPGEICRTLNLTPHTTATALKSLCEEGRAARVGRGPRTRYRAKGNSSGGESIGPGGSGNREVTVQGRIMEILQERGWASADELAQVVGVPRELIVKECGALLRQEEIRMERRDGRPVYVCRSFS